MSALRIVPCDFPTAVAFVAMHHRHHQPPVGHKFSIGLADNDELVGVAIVGRPVARAYQDGLTLEVTRTAVAESIPNGNSMLYGAAWRAAKELGYRRLITYTQEGESGASLRGAGWRVVAQRKPRPGWDMPSRRRTPRGTDNIARTLWEVAEAASSPTPSETGEGEHVAREVFTADGIPFVRCSCSTAKSPTSHRWLSEHVPNGGVAELQAVVKRQAEGAKA